jgi:hypothetical protein
MGSFLGWFVGLVVPIQEIFFLPLLLYSRPSTKYFFRLTVHYFNAFVPIAQQARQAAVLGRLSLNMRLYSYASYVYFLPKVNSAHRTPEENMNNAFLQFTLSESKLSKMNYWPNFSHFYRGSIDFLPGG